ncbi:uncharacterized protein B0T15DRAFT_488195 [Chaetomium strumarium]|uniref:Uncharacterized protein n=1 Tax=Chaetomium strumarium TaxID=1170767 RepID=A0AAJ0H0U6_9PEZI|nr:hypothetical protein B0T15DRAFT_488195 [Chaetomium strumarium]
MPSYVITDVSKGLEFEMLRILSKNRQYIVIGLVRGKAATEKAPRPTRAAITGGKLDYLIANGGYVPQWDAYDPIGELAEEADMVSEKLAKLYQTNIAGNIQLCRYFLPLILRGDVKKVIAFLSGLADLNSLNGLGLTNSPLYALTTAGLNVLMAKYSAQYKKDGVLFVSIWPGMVDVGHFDNAGSSQGHGGQVQGGHTRLPGPTKPDVAMQNVINLWEKASIENGIQGAQGGNLQLHRLLVQSTAV